jgi:hypothetical protein
MLFGSTSAICGNATNSATQTIIATQNGRMPAKIRAIECVDCCLRA